MYNRIQSFFNKRSSIYSFLKKASLEEVNLEILPQLRNFGSLIYYKNFKDSQTSVNADYSAGSSTVTVSATRSTNPATYVDANGVIQTLSTNNVPRWTQGDYTYYGFVSNPGLLMEQTSTNLVPNSADMTAASWTASSVTVTANTATAPDGGTNADTLTATGSNGTVLLTTAVTAGCYSVFLKRKTGTGQIQITANGGVYWKSVTLSSSSWYRVQVSTTSASQKCGIRIVTSGDEIYAWGNQFENLKFATTYIATSGSSKARNAETLTFPISGNRSANSESLFFTFTPFFTGSDLTTNNNAINTDTKSRLMRFNFGVTGNMQFLPNSNDSSTVSATHTTTLQKNVKYTLAMNCSYNLNPSSTAKIYVNKNLEASSTTNFTANAWGTNTTMSGTVNGIVHALIIYSDMKSDADVSSIVQIIDPSQYHPVAATYYVSNSGSDANAGTSTTTPFENVSRANNIAKPGDYIYLKRGDTFRETITAVSGSSAKIVTYGAYGTGAKPKLLASIDLSDTSYWTNAGGNIWTTAAVTLDVGNLIFNNESSTGVKQESLGAVAAQGDFYWAPGGTNLLSVYSTSNPGSYYTHIEAAYLVHSMNVSSKNYVTIENLDFRYPGGHGVSGTTSTNVIVQDCEFYYIGGSFQNGTAAPRFGNAIQFYDAATNITVRRNLINQVYDAGITWQGTSASKTILNCYAYNNIIINCEYSLEHWFSTSSTTVTNVLYMNNTCLYAGYGWGHLQRPDGARGYHLVAFTNSATHTNVGFYNNIFYEAASATVRINNDSQKNKWTMDYNDYYNTVGSYGRITSPADTYYNTLSDWQTITGYEGHAISNDPLFVSGSDYHLQAGSPAKNVGTDLSSYFTSDYENATRTAWDIGAYKG